MLRTIGQGAAHHGTAAGSPPAYLNNVLASTVFDLDATIAASYPGTGTTWANLVPAPADGAAQTAYDFYRGDGTTSSTYPTFNGSAGSAAAYWDFDGGDYFRLKSGINTAFLNNLHKTTGGQDWWVAFTISQPDAAANAFFSTGEGASNHGIRIFDSSVESFTSGQGNGTTFSNVNAGTIPVSTNVILLMSHSHADNQTRFWVNSGTAATVAHTYGATTTNPSLPAVIGAQTNAGIPMNAGTRLYSFAMGNEYLDNTKAAAIIAHLEARHARDYVP